MQHCSPYGYTTALIILIIIGKTLVCTSDVLLRTRAFEVCLEMVGHVQVKL